MLNTQAPSAQNVAPKDCIDLPKGASGPGTFVEAGPESIWALISEVSLSVHLRHVAHYKRHRLGNVVKL